MARRTVKPLVRLYPKRWRDRYGREMESLVEDLPSDLGVALDLLLGAVRAYADEVARNRVLSAAAGFLQGVCVAVLVQGIAFLTMILASERTSGETAVQVGPFTLATVTRLLFLGRAEALAGTQPADQVLPVVFLLAMVVAALALVLATPRLIRKLE